MPQLTKNVSQLTKNEQIARTNRWAAWRWGSLVVGMLGLQVVLGVVAITLATNDDSVAVVPDYYEKALRWDDEVARRSASDALAYQASVRITDDGMPVSGIRLELRDAQDQPVEIRAGVLRTYRHLRAADVRSINVPASADGVVRCDGCFNHPGLWELDFELTDASGNQFLLTRTIDVGGGP